VIDGLTFLAELPFRIASCCDAERAKRKAPRRSVRKAVTAGETASLVCMLTFPQLVLQVFGSAYYDRDLTVQYDLDVNAGRIVCADSGKWVEDVGIGLAVLIYILAVSVAWISRMLPSAFNETSKIFQAAAFVTVLALLIVPLMVLTDVPAHNPDLMVS